VGGFTDYLKMILGWWSSPHPVHEPLCFDLVTEVSEFSIHDESHHFSTTNDSHCFSVVNDPPHFTVANDCHEFDINGKEC